jgi:hypothetical protein
MTKERLTVRLTFAVRTDLPIEELLMILISTGVLVDLLAVAAAVR